MLKQKSVSLTEHVYANYKIDHSGRDKLEELLTKFMWSSNKRLNVI